MILGAINLPIPIENGNFSDVLLKIGKKCMTENFAVIKWMQTFTV
jgi:hypothetical protein